MSFATASSIAKVAQIPYDYQRSPSPEPPQEQTFDSWFQPASIVPPIAFQPASSAITEPTALPTGFMKASNKGWIAPSSVALAKAKAKMKDIWEEAEADPEPMDTSSSRRRSEVDGIENAFTMTSNLASSPQRPALRAVENSLHSPSTPTPLGFSRPSAMAKPLFSPPIADQVTKSKQKSFKSPLLTQRASGNGGTSSPLNPASQLSAFTTAGSRHPLASPLTTGTPRNNVISRTSGPASFTTPAHPSSILQRGRVNPKKNTPLAFVTPFKPGMKPGQPGRSRLEQTVKDAAMLARPEKAAEDWLTKERPGGKERAKEINNTGVFDLSAHSSTTSSISDYDWFFFDSDTTK